MRSGRIDCKVANLRYREVIQKLRRGEMTLRGRNYDSLLQVCGYQDRGIITALIDAKKNEFVYTKRNTTTVAFLIADKICLVANTGLEAYYIHYNNKICKVIRQDFY